MFRQELEEYLKEYLNHLSATLTPQTISKHSRIIGYCIEYIDLYHSVKGFEDITLSMISSKLYGNYQSHFMENISRPSMLKIIKKYFEYIYETYGIGNKQLLNKLKNPSRR